MFISRQEHSLPPTKEKVPLSSASAPAVPTLAGSGGSTVSSKQIEFEEKVQRSLRKQKSGAQKRRRRKGGEGSKGGSGASSSSKKGSGVSADDSSIISSQGPSAAVRERRNTISGDAPLPSSSKIDFISKMADAEKQKSALQGSVTKNALVWELMQEARSNLNEREKDKSIDVSPEFVITNKILKMRAKRKRRKKMDRAKGQGIHIPAFIEPLVALLSANAHTMDSSYFNLEELPKPFIQNIKELIQAKKAGSINTKRTARKEKGSIDVEAELHAIVDALINISNDAAKHQQKDTVIEDFINPSGGARMGVALMMQFLKDANLFTDDELHDVLSAFDIGFGNYRIDSVHSALFVLPQSNCNFLKGLVEWLRKLALTGTQDKPQGSAVASSGNKMTLGKLAELFGPLIFIPKALKQGKDKKLERKKNRCIALISFIILDFEKLFNRTDLKYLYNKKGKLQVEAGKLKNLVAKMIDTNYSEKGYADVILLTHTYYTTSEALLEKLLKIHKRNSTLPTSTRNWQHTIRMRVLQLLLHWIANYYLDLTDNKEFMSRLESFLEDRPRRGSAIDDEEKVFIYLRKCKAKMQRLVKEDQEKREYVSKSFMVLPMPGGSCESLKELLDTDEEGDTTTTTSTSAVTTSGGLYLTPPKLYAKPNDEIPNAGTEKSEEKSEKKPEKSQEAPTPESESSLSRGNLLELPENNNNKKEKRKSQGYRLRQLSSIKINQILVKEEEEIRKSAGKIEEGENKNEEGKEETKNEEGKEEKEEGDKEEKGEGEKKKEGKRVTIRETDSVIVTKPKGFVPPPLARQGTEMFWSALGSGVVKLQQNVDDLDLAYSSEEEGKDEEEKEEKEKEKDDEENEENKKEKEKKKKEKKKEKKGEGEKKDKEKKKGKKDQKAKKEKKPENNKEKKEETKTKEKGKSEKKAEGEKGEEKEVPNKRDLMRSQSDRLRREKPKEKVSTISQEKQRTRLKSVDNGDLSRRNLKEKEKHSKILKRKADKDKDSDSSDSDIDSLIYGSSVQAGESDSDSEDEAMPEILQILNIDRKTNKRLVKNLETLFGLKEGTTIAPKVNTLASGSVVTTTLNVPSQPVQQAKESENSKDNSKHKDNKLKLTKMVGSPSHSFTEINPEDIALQLTLIDHELYKAIRTNELLQKRFTEREKSPFFSIMADRFNLTANWVSQEIFKHETASGRGEAISHFIKITQCCRDMKNFNSVFAILAGLNNTAVSRLKLSWEKVPKKEQAKMKKLMELVDNEGNYGTYRKQLRKTKPPLVPYLALFSKDLFAIEESSPTWIAMEGEPKEVVNFKKLRLLWSIIRRFLEYQEDYNIATDTELFSFLSNVQLLSENEQYENSYRLEPRGGGGASS